MQLSLSEISRILKTGAPAEPGERARGYSIDSRTVRHGELFFAVRGEKLDGHDYVPQALSAGAIGAVVESSRRADFASSLQSKLMAVPNTLSALQQLAAEVRRLWGRPVVAVTGSAGKTTTKQTIAALLRTRARVLESERNLNNHFGLPLSLLRLDESSDVGVFEMGMSAPGEIRLLASLAQPDLGVVTNVSAVHLEFFPDVDAIARAKYELIEMLGPRAWAVLNADDPRVSRFGDRMGGRVLYFGIDHPAHLRAQNLVQDAAGGFDFTVEAGPLRAIPPGALPLPGLHAGHDAKPEDTRFHLPLVGRHNVMNVLAALAVCSTFGIPPQLLQDAVSNLQPAAMRGEIVRLPNGATVVNDCYNSNPEAVETMLVSTAALPGKRHFAVLGGMMELGPAARSLHERCGRRVAELKFDGLFTVGELAKSFADGALAAGMPPNQIAHFASPEEAGARLREILDSGDVVLLKGSRAVHLERAWNVLQPATAGNAK